MLRINYLGSMLFKNFYSKTKSYALNIRRNYHYDSNYFNKQHSRLITNFEIINRDGIYVTTSNGTENLNKILDTMSKYKINITQIETKVLKDDNKASDQEVMFRLNFEGMIKDQNIQACINELKSSYKVSINENVPIVPWFPITLDDPIPHLSYTDNENKTWAYIYEHLRLIQRNYMTKQFNDNLDKLAKLKIMTSKAIPQLSILDNYLWNETGFRLKPVHGILSQREFLNALAHKVFCCTQYIRHHDSPEYSPEPDIVHELLGHIAMLIDKDFAELSQQIGLYSLGATEDQIAKLGALYLYTVEFGVCKEKEDIKAYGAGIASSMTELQYFGQGKAEIRKLDPQNDLPLDFPIQTVQPVYFLSETYKEATDVLIKYGESLHKPFQASYCNTKKQVNISRNIKTRAAEERNIYEDII